MMLLTNAETDAAPVEFFNNLGQEIIDKGYPSAKIIAGSTERLFEFKITLVKVDGEPVADKLGKAQAAAQEEQEPLAAVLAAFANFIEAAKEAKQAKAALGK
jgi:hypothetical protein